MRLDAGDLLVLPPGIYHRFTLDENNFARAMRLFKVPSRRDLCSFECGR